MIALLSAVQPIAAQDGAHRAGLVVVHGDGRVMTRCVAFDEPQISGSDLLARSGLTTISTTGALGQTICSLNGEGCPATACWCACSSTPCIYWVYHNQRPDGSWAYANLGAAQRIVTDGDVDAWVWGEITQPPPAITFEAICGDGGVVAPPEATPVAVAPTVPAAVADSSTPAPTAAAVPETEPPVPTATSTSTAAPIATQTRAPSPTASLSPAPTATLTSTPASVTTPLPTTGMSEVDGPVPATATRTQSAATTTASAPQSTVQSEPAPAPAQGVAVQYLAFGVAVGIVALAFVLLSRRRGA